MTTAAVAFALLAVCLWLAGRGDRRRARARRARLAAPPSHPRGATERAVASALRPRTGSVEASPQRAPINRNGSNYENRRHRA